MENNNSSPRITHTLIVSADQKSERLDNFIHTQLPQYSRTFIQKLIEKNAVTINDKKAKASTPIKPHDTITINIPKEEPAYIIEPTPEQKKQLTDLNVNVLYMDDDFAIIDKPANLMVHRPSTFSDTLTLVDWLVYYLKEIVGIGHPSRPGIVHRLDKDTSGLMIIARTNFAHNMLTDLFKSRKIKKTYLAVVKGHPDPEGTIDLPIGRNPAIRNQMTVNGIEARKAITHYKVIQYFDNAALLEVNPITGRTHQIRVHLKAIGHPIIGDEVYGTKSPLIKRQALHAHKLSFTIKGKSFSFESPLPEDITLLIKKLSRMKKNNL